MKKLTIKKFKKLVENEFLRGWDKGQYIKERNCTDTEYKFDIFTYNNRYTIFAKLDNNSNYLGCVVSDRKPRTGETHLRGSDLPDGKLTVKTWKKIISAIVRYELEKLHIVKFKP